MQLGNTVGFERQNEKLMAHLQKLIYTSAQCTTRAHQVIKNHMGRRPIFQSCEKL